VSVTFFSTVLGALSRRPTLLDAPIAMYTKPPSNLANQAPSLGIDRRAAPRAHVDSRAGPQSATLASGQTLTPEQQDLVTRHLRLAQMLATKFKCRRITIEERLSAAYLGLCQSALRFKPELGISFATFAGYRIIGAINDEHRYLAKEDVGAVDVYELESGVEAPDAFREIEQRDELEAVLARFCPLDREWVEAYLATGNWYEAARRLGRGKSAVFYVHQRVRARLAEIFPSLTMDI
jgi:RNA polymerase sigma factor (sigma-70 family)